MKNFIPYEAKTKGGILRYWDSLKLVSQKNRKLPTDAEKQFWQLFLKNDKTGYRFLRQKPINRFILVFYCPKLMLAIELDGGYHKKRIGNDILRDNFLKACGIITIRFKNLEIYQHPDQIDRSLNLIIKQRIDEINQSIFPSLSKRE